MAEHSHRPRIESVATYVLSPADEDPIIWRFRRSGVLAMYLMEEDSPPNNGDPAFDETFKHDGTYHYYEYGLYVGGVGRANTGGAPYITGCPIRSPRVSGGDGFQGMEPRGNAPQPAGIPDPGIANGCISVGGTWPDLTQNMTVIGYMDDPQGALGQIIGGYRNHLAGGIVGTRRYADGEWQGWGFHRQGGFDTDTDYLNYVFRVGSNILATAEPEGHLGYGYVLRILNGDTMSVGWPVGGQFENFLSVQWVNQDITGANPPESDPTLTIGTLDFNTDLSGYWGNLSNGFLEDHFFWDRALSNSEVLNVFNCMEVG